MDYRKRNYYLVKFDWSSREMRMEYLKLACKKLKMHAPYNHIKNNKRDFVKTDDDFVFFPDVMISCLKEDAEAIEYELRKMTRRDNYGYYTKLTKEICNQ